MGIDTKGWKAGRMEKADTLNRRCSHAPTPWTPAERKGKGSSMPVFPHRNGIPHAPRPPAQSSFLAFLGQHE